MTASQRSLPTSRMGELAHLPARLRPSPAPFAVRGRQRTSAPSTSWPSRKTSAETTTASPTTALAGYSPVGVRGRTLSITMRPIIGIGLPQRGESRNRPYGARAPRADTQAGPGPGRAGGDRQWRPATVAGDEGPAQLHRPAQAPGGPGPPPRAGHEPAVVL